MTVRSVVVGVGGAGCRIASKLGSKLSMDRVYVSSDEDELGFSGIKIHLPYEGGGKGRLLSFFYKRAGHIRSILNGHSLCIVVGGLGGFTGSTLIPKVVKLATEACEDVVTVCVMPFSFEKSRHFSSALALKRLRSSRAKLLLVDNDSLMDLRIPLAEGYELLNEALTGEFSSMLSGDGGIGKTDLMEAMRDDYCILSLAYSEDVEELGLKVTDRLKALKGVSKALVKARGPLTARDLALISSRIRFQTGNIDIRYGLATVKGGAGLVLVSSAKGSEFEGRDPLSEILKDRVIDEEDGYLKEKIDLGLPQLETF